MGPLAAISLAWFDRQFPPPRTGAVFQADLAGSRGRGPCPTGRARAMFGR